MALPTAGTVDGKVGMAQDPGATPTVTPALSAALHVESAAQMPAALKPEPVEAEDPDEDEDEELPPPLRIPTPPVDDRASSSSLAADPQATIAANAPNSTPAPIVPRRFVIVAPVLSLGEGMCKAGAHRRFTQLVHGL
jgi:hypothetical protein